MRGGLAMGNHLIVPQGENLPNSRRGWRGGRRASGGQVKGRLSLVAERLTPRRQPSSQRRTAIPACRCLPVDACAPAIITLRFIGPHLVIAIDQAVAAVIAG